MPRSPKKTRKSCCVLPFKRSQIPAVKQVLKSNGVDPEKRLKCKPGVSLVGWRYYEVHLDHLEKAARRKIVEELKQLKKELKKLFNFKEEIKEITALEKNPIDASDLQHLQEGPAVIEDLAKVALDSLRAASFVDFQQSLYEPTTEPFLPPVGENPGDFCLGETNLGERSFFSDEDLANPWD